MSPPGSGASAHQPRWPGAPGCTVFPADNVWNVRIDGRPVAARSATLIGSIGTNRTSHMDFGSYAGHGIPYQVVDGATPRQPVTFGYDDESDPGPYPIPDAPLIEGGSDSGMSDPRFDDDVMHELDRFTGSDLEVVDTTGLVNGP